MTPIKCWFCRCGCSMCFSFQGCFFWPMCFFLPLVILSANGVSPARITKNASNTFWFSTRNEGFTTNKLEIWGNIGPFETLNRTEEDNVWLQINGLIQHVPETSLCWEVPSGNFAWQFRVSEGPTPWLHQDALMGKEQLVLLTTLSPGLNRGYTPRAFGVY